MAGHLFSEADGSFAVCTRTFIQALKLKVKGSGTSLSMEMPNSIRTDFRNFLLDYFVDKDFDPVTGNVRGAGKVFNIHQASDSKSSSAKTLLDSAPVKLLIRCGEAKYGCVNGVRVGFYPHKILLQLYNPSNICEGVEYQLKDSCMTTLYFAEGTGTPAQVKGGSYYLKDFKYKSVRPCSLRHEELLQARLQVYSAPLLPRQALPSVQDRVSSVLSHVWGSDAALQIGSWLQQVDDSCKLAAASQATDVSTYVLTLLSKLLGRKVAFNLFIRPFRRWYLIQEYTPSHTVPEDCDNLYRIWPSGSEAWLLKDKLLQDLITELPNNRRLNSIYEDWKCLSNLRTDQQTKGICDLNEAEMLIHSLGDVNWAYLRQAHSEWRSTGTLCLWAHDMFLELPDLDEGSDSGEDDYDVHPDTLVPYLQYSSSSADIALRDCHIEFNESASSQPADNGVLEPSSMLQGRSEQDEVTSAADDVNDIDDDLKEWMAEFMVEDDTNYQELEPWCKLFEGDWLEDNIQGSKELFVQEDQPSRKRSRATV